MDFFFCLSCATTPLLQIAIFLLGSIGQTLAQPKPKPKPKPNELISPFPSSLFPQPIRPQRERSYSTHFASVSTAARTLFVLLGLAYLLFDRIAPCILFLVRTAAGACLLVNRFLNPMFKI
jgi:hypothetical protein